VRGVARPAVKQPLDGRGGRGEHSGPAMSKLVYGSGKGSITIDAARSLRGSMCDRAVRWNFVVANDECLIRVEVPHSDNSQSEMPSVTNH
jgi:hypothetical protein